VTEPRRPPNILLLLADQHRADAMGCAGDAVIRTPALDRLAAQGVRFQNAFCTSPLCMPSRASFTTGLYAHNHGVLSNAAGNLLPVLPTFMRALQAAGYHTAGIGKFHYFLHSGISDMDELADQLLGYGFDEAIETEGKEVSEFHHGPWTRYLAEHGLEETHRADFRRRRTEERAWYAGASPLGEDHHHDAYIGRLAERWLERYDGDRLFFLWASWVGPHLPWDAPGRYATMYDPAIFPSPVPDSMGDPPAVVRRYVERFRLRDARSEEIASMRASYYGLISHIDYWVGRLLDVLDRRGRADDTVVVYFSDHGEMLGEHQLLQKSVFYEEAIRVPLIVRDPRHARSAVAAALVELVDLPPTLLELAGQQPYAACEGRSLVPLLDEPSSPPAGWRDAVFSELKGERMIRTDRYKYTYRAGEPRQELFDLANDPRELRNLGGDPTHAAVEQELQARLLDWLVRTDRPVTSRDVQPGWLDAYRTTETRELITY
jgi:choline-sulfatase